MAPSVFALLVVAVALGVAWGGVAVALRQSQQLTIQRTDEADGWAITPAHLRMW